jgi:hypothetical protein
MAEFSRKEASGAVILLIYMSGKLQGLRDNEIFVGVPRAVRDWGSGGTGALRQNGNEAKRGLMITSPSPQNFPGHYPIPNGSATPHFVIPTEAEGSAVPPNQQPIQTEGSLSPETPA